MKKIKVIEAARQKLDHWYDGAGSIRCAWQIW